MARLFILAFVLHVLVVAAGVATTYTLLKPDTSLAGGSATRQIEYHFHPVERVIVSRPDDGRERYFVLDLMLLTEDEDAEEKIARIDPLVRNSAISYLNGFGYQELRALAVPDLQSRLEAALFDDFERKNVNAPFDHVLIS